MVEEMGGRIQVISHIGDGATFTVLLPTGESHGHRAGGAAELEQRAGQALSPLEGALAARLKAAEDAAQ
jgi:hypothetical protein